MATIDYDVAEARVRYLMGDVSTGILSSDTLTGVLDLAIAEYTDDDTYYCDIIYYTLLECIRHLLRVNQANAGITGNQSKRKEVRGKTTIEVTFSDSTDYITDGWYLMYKDYIAHPEYVCESLRPERVFELMNIGGVKQDKSRLANNRNSLSGWDMTSKTKFNRKQAQSLSRTIPRNKDGFSY